VTKTRKRRSHPDVSPLRLIRWCVQWQDKKDWEHVPIGLRGIYALHQQKFNTVFNVVYIGMASSGQGIRRRLHNHVNSRRKGPNWSHFSFFAVWENIREDEIRELEGLFREIYRKDAQANSLNKQKRSKDIQRVRKKRVEDWQKAAERIST
jgi:hypothetical protein